MLQLKHEPLRLFHASKVPFSFSLQDLEGPLLIPRQSWPSLLEPNPRSESAAKLKPEPDLSIGSLRALPEPSGPGGLLISSTACEEAFPL